MPPRPPYTRFRTCLQGGWIDTCSPPLHATHLTETVSGLRGLSFERLLSATNKMADHRNFLAASLIFLSLIPLAASFQCIGLLFCTLLIQRKKKIISRRHVFAVYLTSASRNSPERIVYMVKSYPAGPGAPGK